MKDRTLTTDESISLSIQPILTNAITIYNFHSRKNHLGNLEESFKTITEVILTINNDIAACKHSFEITYDVKDSVVIAEFHKNNKFQVLLGIINSFVILLKNIEEAIIQEKISSVNNTLKFLKQNLDINVNFSGEYRG